MFSAFLWVHILLRCILSYREKKDNRRAICLLSYLLRDYKPKKHYCFMKKTLLWKNHRLFCKEKNLIIWKFISFYLFFNHNLNLVKTSRSFIIRYTLIFCYLSILFNFYFIYLFIHFLYFLFIHIFFYLTSCTEITFHACKELILF